jgi:hypothetical protein
MYCATCGNQVAGDGRPCPSCGADPAGAGRQAGPAQAAPAAALRAQPPAPAFDARRWTLNDKLVGGVFIIGVVMLAYLLLTALYQQLPFSLPVPRDLVLLGAAGLNLLLVFIGFVLKPSAPGIGIGWGAGAVLALLAAIVAVAPLALALRPQHA